MTQPVTLILPCCTVEGCDRPPVTKGLCGAHYRRLRLDGSVDEGKPVRAIWTDAEVSTLRAAYAAVRRGTPVDLDAIARSIGKSRHSVAMKASRLGISKPTAGQPRPSRARFKSDEDRRAFKSAITKERLQANGHPRGMAGKKHSTETKEQLGLISRDRWLFMSEDQKSEMILKGLKTKRSNGTPIVPQTPRGTWKAGWREIGGQRKYFRSRWEANYARYLEWLRIQGQIASWEHEPETFWFESIRRGVRSYLPDFRVTENSGASAYHEVKGWMDSRSKTTIRRFRKYYPNEILIVIDTKAYRAIERKAAGLIGGWE